MSNSPVQKIKERLKIEEVVSSYIKLEPAGANFKARCPFHNEKTPSFFVSSERDSYYCFGCGAKGDIFTFVEEFEGLDFKGALRLLAERAGVSLAEYSGAPSKESDKERLYKAMQEASEYFENNLSYNERVLNYLAKRGLTQKSIKEFNIGFAKLDWSSTYQHLKGKGFTDKEIETAGLAKKGESGKTYDRFRGRIMFPIKDSSGRVIAFSGRIFEDDGKSAKYLNSPETPIFSKSSVLYGIEKAKEAIRKNDFSILVEGQLDLILSHQVGFKNTVATSGTALADAITSKENAISNLGLVRRLSNNIVLAYDADRAGLSASGRAAKIALSFGMDVKVAKLKDGSDPADVISKSGVDAWREAIRNSKHIVEFLTDKILETTKNDQRKALREIKEKVLPYVGMIDSAVEKAFFIKKISDMSGAPTSALEEDLRKIDQDLKFERREEETKLQNKQQLERRDYILHRLLGVLLWQEGVKEPSIDILSITQDLERILNKKKAEIWSAVEDVKSDLIFEAEVFYDKDKDLSSDTLELLANLESESLKEELGRSMFELKKAEMDKDGPKVTELLKAIQLINNKMQSLKNK